PDLPAHYLDRSDQTTALTARLLATAGPVAITGRGQAARVQGMGGIGKSVLAAAMAHAPEIQQGFPDGIHWIAVGRQPNVFPPQVELARQLGEAGCTVEPFTAEATGKDSLRQ